MGHGVLLLALLFGSLVSAHATTIRVPDDVSTLAEAVDRSSPGDRIELPAGTCSPSRTGESFPIVLRGADVVIAGAGAGVTVLDAEGGSRLFDFGADDRSTVRDLSLVGGFARDGGGAIRVAGASPTLSRVVVLSAAGGGRGDALLVTRGSPRIDHTLVTASLDGPTIRVEGGAPLFEHVTLARNAGAILELDGDARPEIRHSVLADPGEPLGSAIGLRVVSPRAAPVLERVLWNCWEGTIVFAADPMPAQREALASARTASGLREADPQFVDPGRGDFRLLEASLARRLPGSARPDDEAGAFGGEGALSYAPPLRQVPTGSVDEPGLLGPSVPNPLSLSTKIHFTVSRSTVVDLGVYNVLGQRVRTLHAGDLPAGEHSRIWDGRDDAGDDLPPGIYFVRVTQGTETESQRLVLLR